MKLCSEGFRKFYEIAYINTDNPAEATERMGKAMDLIAEELHLGKVDIRVEAPATMYAPQGIDITALCFLSERGCEVGGMVEHAFVTGENGCVWVYLYPEKGYQWDDEDKGAVAFLAQNIFVITGRARVMGMLTQMNKVDTLTGMANVAGLQQFCGMLMSKGIFDQYAYILLNVKNFSAVNRRFGIEKGVEILRRYGKVLQNFVHCDEIIASSGGDSFVVLIQSERVEEVLEALRSVTIDGVDGDESVEIQVRAGVYPIQPGDTMNEVMNNSAIALNHARQSLNQDFVIYSDMMMVQILKEKEISTIFPQALKDKEFSVYYKPKGEVTAGFISDCDAMVRWLRDGQIVPTLEFVPILEREGTIRDLDFYVLDQVCQDVRRWMNEGKEDIHVAVHFSKLHKKGESLDSHIRYALERYEIPEGFVTVE